MNVKTDFSVGILLLAKKMNCEDSLLAIAKETVDFYGKTTMLHIFLWTIV